MTKLSFCQNDVSQFPLYIFAVHYEAPRDNGSKRADSICDMSDMCVFLGEYHISYIVGIVLVHLLADAERAFYVSIKETKVKVKPYAPS